MPLTKLAKDASTSLWTFSMAVFQVAAKSRTRRSTAFASRPLSPAASAFLTKAMSLGKQAASSASTKSSRCRASRSSKNWTSASSAAFGGSASESSSPPFAARRPEEDDAVPRMISWPKASPRTEDVADMPSFMEESPFLAGERVFSRDAEKTLKTRPESPRRSFKIVKIASKLLTRKTVASLGLPKLRETLSRTCVTSLRRSAIAARAGRPCLSSLSGPRPSGKSASTLAASSA
mmetsp:Transcript_14702/g.44532  ORF Transcript_14702/g.44532 Transcript_14702/m.44532 type:complete len:235 (-) Transcript_14702:54-758(-)